MQQSIILCFFIMCELIFGTSALHQPGCGKQSKDFSVPDSSRIIGGSPAEYMEYPWIVYVETIGKNSTMMTKCTGSILHPKFILTACHCVMEAISTIVIAGAINIDDPTQNHLLKRKVEDFIFHPKTLVLYGDGVMNDIALIKIRTPINLGPKSPFKPICIPTRKDKFDGKIIAAGFGCTKIKVSPGFPSILMKAVVPRLDMTNCKLMYRREEIGFAYVEKILSHKLNESQIVSKLKEFDEVMEKLLTNTTLCTIKTACQGDSGSPAMCINTRNKLYYICGVASFASKRLTLTVYAKVIEFTKWISDEILQRTK